MPCTGCGGWQLSHTDLAALIAQRLRDGLMHPGDGRNPVLLSLPVFRTNNQPPEVARHVATTTTMIAEAVIALIEGEGGCVIVDKHDYEDLQGNAGGGSRVVPVHCRCDRTRSNLLMLLTVSDKPRIVLDGHQLITGLARRDPHCPHAEMT